MQCLRLAELPSLLVQLRTELLVVGLGLFPANLCERRVGGRIEQSFQLLLVYAKARADFTGVKILKALSEQAFPLGLRFRCTLQYAFRSRLPFVEPRPSLTGMLETQRQLVQTVTVVESGKPPFRDALLIELVELPRFSGHEPLACQRVWRALEPLGSGHAVSIQL
ncbi:hypothetical protein SDC9_78816 [bioreactor metagenome]|uniref:Uncharacterized protein n=1 Tax=bioreactor metagenome TaxID=1076179 RepID=A0A644Z259_9ZZZZ